jgi:uncharacterized protein YndB with AHSA1/START domain
MVTDVKKHPENTTDREIKRVRIFNAPREVVFEMWTTPEHLDRWWGPTGFTNTTKEMEFKVGGKWHYIMHGPDGRDYVNKMVYTGIQWNEYLTYNHHGDIGSGTPQFQVEVIFEDEPEEKTRLTMRMIFPTPQARDEVLEKYGASEGLDQTLGRMEDLLVTMPASACKTVCITRSFKSPRDLVFEAWTKPEILAQWWGPKCFTNPVCKVDPRPNGKIYIQMQGHDGTIYPMGGNFQVVKAPEKLVFTSIALDDNGQELLKAMNTIIFEDCAGQTTLHLKAVVIKSTQVGHEMCKGMEQGWSESLFKLADLDLLSV